MWKKVEKIGKESKRIKGGKGRDIRIIDKGRMQRECVGDEK